MRAHIMLLTFGKFRKSILQIIFNYQIKKFSSKKDTIAHLLTITQMMNYMHLSNWKDISR